MDNFTYQYPVRQHFGKGCAEGAIKEEMKRVGSRVLLEINATYDGDGSSSTSDDRSEVTYSVELTGKAAGQILRNGYYRVAANITGLVGQDCQVSVTVADWETPVMQSVDLGA